MKVFYGGIFLEKKRLQEAGINYPIKVEYYKLINEGDYGILVVKKEYKDNKVFIEKEEIQNLKNEHTTDELLDIFKRCSVTPITAQDIIKDLL